MTRDEILAAIAPDPDRPYRTVRVPGGWFGVAGDERWPSATKAEALEFVRLRKLELREGGQPAALHHPARIR